MSGLTAGVLPGGVDVISPVQNAALADRIVEKGVLISEQTPGLQPQAFHFPLRNRLISGLACALVVVEATLKSGTMITARCALDQSRDVLAIPGHPLDPRASGSNRLISDGAPGGVGCGPAKQRLFQQISHHYHFQKYLSKVFGDGATV